MKRYLILLSLLLCNPIFSMEDDFKVQNSLNMEEDLKTNTETVKDKSETVEQRKCKYISSLCTSLSDDAKKYIYNKLAKIDFDILKKGDGNFNKLINKLGKINIDLVGVAKINFILDNLGIAKKLSTNFKFRFKKQDFEIDDNDFNLTATELLILTLIIQSPKTEKRELFWFKYIYEDEFRNKLVLNTKFLNVFLKG